MTGAELIVLAAVGGVITLRSPRGRAAVGRATRSAWRGTARGVHEVRYRIAERGNVVLPAETVAEMAATVAPKPAPKPVAAPRPARDTRPPERITRIADGVHVGHQIGLHIEKIGLHMDEIRAVTRALNAAGEVRAEGLLGLLDAMTGIQSVLAGVANLITDIAEHADTEMWVDMRAVGSLYEAASNVSMESQTIRQAMAKVRDLYAEEIAVEEKQAEGGVRQLNPALGQSRAA